MTKSPRHKSKHAERLASFIGSKGRPVEFLVADKMLEDTRDDSASANVMKAAFKGLQEGFGFGLRFHNLTVCEYADILRHVQPTIGDATSGLSTLHTPLHLEHAYLGLRYTGKLIRLTDRRRKIDCDVLESLILAHQQVLSRVCTEGDCLGGNKGSSEEPRNMNEAINALTWSLCRYCVVLPSLAGMQDFLRVVDTPIGTVDVQRERSTLYSNEYIYPYEDRTLGSYCWRYTPLTQIGQKNQALYVCYTLLPSMAGGLVAKTIEQTGIYVTVSEEIIRGHTGQRGKRGKYYEWVSPVIPGVKGKRVRTFYLAVGCSLVLPSTFAVRIGAHSTEEVVLFVHSVRVRLPHRQTTIFMKRGKLYVPRDLDEYGNITDLLEPSYKKANNCISWVYFCDISDDEEQCTIGTVPSITNVPLNTKQRDRIAELACNLKLGIQGIAEAYRRTPVLKLKTLTMIESGSEDEEEGVQSMGVSSTYVVDDVPYAYYEYITGNSLHFPVALGRLWKLQAAKESNSSYEGSMSISESASSFESEASSEDGSGSEGEGSSQDGSGDQSDHRS